MAYTPLTQSLCDLPGQLSVPYVVFIPPHFNDILRLSVGLIVTTPSVF